MTPFTAYVTVSHARKLFWPITVGLIAHPYTRSVGWKVAGYGFRASGAAAWAAATTPFVAGGSFSLASFAGAAAAGYALGASVGTGIAYAGWGEEGARTAVDVYTSPALMGSAILSIPTNIYDIGSYYMS